MLSGNFFLFFFKLLLPTSKHSRMLACVTSEKSPHFIGFCVVSKALKQLPTTSGELALYLCLLCGYSGCRMQGCNSQLIILGKKKYTVYIYIYLSLNETLLMYISLVRHSHFLDFMWLCGQSLCVVIYLTLCSKMLSTSLHSFRL